MPSCGDCDVTYVLIFGCDIMSVQMSSSVSGGLEDLVVPALIQCADCGVQVGESFLVITYKLQMANTYEEVVRGWGYNMPEVRTALHCTTI